MIITINGRKLIGHLGSILEYYPEVLAERDALKLKLAQTQQMLDKTLAALNKLSAAVTARHEAEARLEQHRREKEERLRLYRAPALNETLH
jgi:hypothetical protein